MWKQKNRRKMRKQKTVTRRGKIKERISRKRRKCDKLRKVENEKEDEVEKQKKKKFKQKKLRKSGKIKERRSRKRKK